MFNLRELREKKGITQTEISVKVGVSRQAISLIENGQTKPSVENAKKIAEILDFDWSLFYEDNSDS